MLAAPAIATVVVPVPVDVLAEQADVVVAGQVTVIKSYWDPQHAQIFTHITLSVDEVLKGVVSLGELTIKQVGGTVGDLHSWVFGSPEFIRGDEVLLFLTLNTDATLRVAHLFQGEFSVLADESTGEKFAYREAGVEGVRIMAPGEVSPVAYDLYPFEGFKEWIRALVQGSPGAGAPDRAEPVVQPPWPSTPGLTEFHDQFTFLGSASRWFEPDSNLPVTMFMSVQGEPAAPGGGFDQIRAAYQAWSTVSGANFRYRDGGLTLAEGFQRDGVNAISFRDPLGQIDPPVNCTGTLAIGGYWRISSETRIVNGVSFFRILEGDVVFNDGWQGCMRFYESFANFAEVATHELGHVLGLGHSSDLDATMYFRVHFDGRGASLRADDIAGLRFIYPQTLPSPVYRFSNTQIPGTHFYTISEAEKNYVIQNFPQFLLEGIAFYAYMAQAP